jgi:hypothetical protein
MPEIFSFCPGRNVPETLPREAPQSTMSMGGWQFSARPTTPYQKKIKLTLHGLRWYLNSATGLYDFTTNPTFNARNLEMFYERHETWLPFTLPHQHFGDMLVRFAAPLTVPRGEVNAGGFIAPVEATFIHHNPGYTS